MDSHSSLRARHGLSQKKTLRNSLQKTLLLRLLSLKGRKPLWIRKVVRGQTVQGNITFSHEWRQLVIHFGIIYIVGHGVIFHDDK